MGEGERGGGKEGGRGRPRKPEVKPVSLVMTGAALPPAARGPTWVRAGMSVVPPLSLSLVCSLFFVAIRDGRTERSGKFPVSLPAFMLHAIKRGCRSISVTRTRMYQKRNCAESWICIERVRMKIINAI